MSRKEPVMNFKNNSTRAGITLMEVLISIGILAVGLTAVITIIPAAGSQAKKALTETNKANVGLAAMDDAITRGILGDLPVDPPFVVDPIGTALGSALPSTVLPLETLDGLNQGIATDDVFRSQDDVSYTLENSGQDNPPQPLFYEENASKVKRLSEGAYSWLATLVPQGDENYLLSVVSFYRRDTTAPTLLILTSAPGNSVTFSWTATNRSFRETFPRGSIVLLHDDGGTPYDGSAASRDDDTWEWRRIIFPTLDDKNNTDASDNVGQLMFDADVSGIVGIKNVYVFKGAVGVAERLVRLEGTSPWTQ